MNWRESFVVKLYIWSFRFIFDKIKSKNSIYFSLHLDFESIFPFICCERWTSMHRRRRSHCASSHNFYPRMGFVFVVWFLSHVFSRRFSFTLLTSRLSIRDPNLHVDFFEAAWTIAKWPVSCYGSRSETLLLNHSQIEDTSKKKTFLRLESEKKTSHWGFNLQL